MLTIIYDSENGHSTPDKKARQFVYDTIQRAQVLGDEAAEVVVGTELIIAHFRLAVKEGRISHTRIQFKFGEQIIPIKSTGKTMPYPKGFCDENINVLIEL